MVYCNDCIQDKALCPKCKRNPIYKDLRDYHKEYEAGCYCEGGRHYDS